MDVKLLFLLILVTVGSIAVHVSVEANVFYSVLAAGAAPTKCKEGV